MLKTVQIIEKDCHWIRCEFPIALESANASDDDFCKIAWETAIDDGFVDEDRRSDYEIEIVEDTLMSKWN